MCRAATTHPRVQRHSGAMHGGADVH
jgi:hypothetical protein